MAQALGGELAPLGAAQVEPRVRRQPAARAAAAARIVFPELQGRAAMRARRLEHVAGLPEPLVLAGTLGNGHGAPPVRARHAVPLLAGALGNGHGAPPFYYIIRAQQAAGIDKGQKRGEWRQGGLSRATGCLPTRDLTMLFVHRASDRADGPGAPLKHNKVEKHILTTGWQATRGT